MVATDSHRSLERWDLEADHCQNPCGWADPWAGPWVGCDVLLDPSHCQNVVGVGWVGSVGDAKVPEAPTAGEDHLVAVGVGRAGRRAAVAVEHHKEPAAAGHRELAVGRGVGHSSGGSSEAAGKVPLDAEHAEAGLGEATAAAAAAVAAAVAVAADGAGHRPGQAVGVELEDTEQDAEDRTAGVGAVVAVGDCSRRGRDEDEDEDDSRGGQQIDGCGLDLLCLLFDHILHDLTHYSGMQGIADNR